MIPFTIVTVGHLISTVSAVDARMNVTSILYVLLLVNLEQKKNLND